jgi:hypothetical protein
MCAAQLGKSGGRRQSSDEGEGSGGSVLSVVLVSGIVAASLGMAFCMFGSSEVKGQITANGKPFGNYVLKPEACYSGEHQSFFGVWVAPKLRKLNGREGFQGGIKLVKSHLEEWSVYVESPVECEGFKCAIQELKKEHCPVFDVDVRNTSTTVNDIRVREGHAKLECRYPGGGTLTASLTFDGCK